MLFKKLKFYFFYYQFILKIYIGYNPRLFDTFYLFIDKEIYGGANPRRRL